MTSSIPYTVLTSHILLRRGKVNNLRLDIEDAKVKIEEAIRDYQRASKVSMYVGPFVAERGGGGRKRT